MKKFVAVLALLACTGLGVASEIKPVPSITVTGNGKVVYVPDLGYIHVGVSSEAWTAAEAWKKNEEIVQKIFEALKKHGVEKKDLKTSNVHMQPRYLTKKDEEPQFLGYTASYDLSVTVRKLDQMGTLLDSMVEAGANRNMNISFGCSKLDELIDEARGKAVAEARKKANLYVTGAGARLGDVLGISDSPYHPHPQYFAVDAMAVREAKASLPVAAGEQETSITVTITWSIDNRKVEPRLECPASVLLPGTIQPADRIELAN
jgi:uncharacterized protein YggE